MPAAAREIVSPKSATSESVSTPRATEYAQGHGPTDSGEEGQKGEWRNQELREVVTD